MPVSIASSKFVQGNYGNQLQIAARGSPLVPRDSIKTRTNTAEVEGSSRFAPWV